jgi:ATP-dependent DNA helicase RecQ
MKLAGRSQGAVYDRLAECSQQLYRGPDGTGKPMSLSPSLLRRIAERHPTTLSELDRVAELGPARMERFGAAFLEVLTSS